MANAVTFTNLAPILYRSMDRVAREQVGAIPASMINSSGVTIAKQGDKVQSLRTSGAIDKASYTPAMTVPASGDKVNVMDEFSIDQYVGKELPLVGETVRQLENINEYGKWVEDEFTQMIRSAVNEMEAYHLGVIYKAASRAYGTAGTNPFATNINGLAQIRKILQDNGAPINEGLWTLVMDSSAGAALRSIAQLQKVNESGDKTLLRQGVLGDLTGFMLRESAGVATHTKGTATGFDANGGEAIGETTIAVDGSDAGTILAGDVVSWVGDANKYVVQDGSTASGAAAGNLIINRPGMVEALATTVEGSLGANYTANVAFHRNAVEFAARAPAQPQGGDVASDSLLMVDPLTGMPFEFRLYKGYGMNKIELNIYYGSKAWKPEFIATLLG